MVILTFSIDCFANHGKESDMITYLELLQLVKEGRQPKKIKFGKKIYDWNEDIYERLDEKDRWSTDYLSEDITDIYCDTDLVTEADIEVIEE